MLRTRANRRRKTRPTELEALESRALLTTFTVTSLADTVTDDGQMTLREAIAAADADDSTNSHHIVFADGLNGTIDLQLGELDLYTFSLPALTITGNGRDETIIDAQGNSDIFSSPTAPLTLQSMSLHNSAGNGVENTYPYNSLTLEDAVITGSGGHGVVNDCNCEGYYYGDLNIRNSVITGNANRGVVAEGAINVTMADSEISGNSGGLLFIDDDSFGYFGPNVTIQRSSVVNNVTNEAGGGVRIETAQDVTIEDSLISSNQGTSGGGISSTYAANLQMSRTTVTGNTATGDGGGIYVGNYAQPRLDNVTIAGNVAIRGAGLFVSPASLGRNGRNLSMANSTITGNIASDAGGGIFFDAKDELLSLIHI